LPKTGWRDLVFQDGAWSSCEAGKGRCGIEHEGRWRDYEFRFLSAQGSAAPGIVMDRVVHGRLVGGFAALA
jgi:hypothetical protein